MNAPRPSVLRERVAGHAPRIRDDTIVALATPKGRGAIGIVRLSGPGAEAACARVVVPVGGWPLTPRRAIRCQVHRVDDASALLDDGLITLFPMPASYTGETVIEIGLHGGTFICEAVCAALVHAGARLALPGEFTERAVLHGKADLVRAEAIGDLIDARTGASHRMAMQQMTGALSVRFAKLRESVVSLEALLAYDIDFPEEDDGRLPRTRITEAVQAALTGIAELLATVPAAVLGRDGICAVLAGAPNAGKSSLFNALLGEHRVIVSNVPGTTRDAVEALLEYEPWPIRLVDTAGLRDTHDEVERMGVAASERFLQRAHVVIACAEREADEVPLLAHVRRHTRAPVVTVRTKCDLVSDGDEVSRSVLAVSAVRGDGLPVLLARVSAAAETWSPPDADAPVITRERHQAALATAQRELRLFQDAWEGGELPAPVAAVHVRAAGTALDELIGTVDVDDVLARVFSAFCVGK